MQTATRSSGVSSEKWNSKKIEIITFLLSVHAFYSSDLMSVGAAAKAHLSVVHNYDCDVTATVTTVQRHATSCDFVSTSATETVMQLRCDCDQK